MTYLRDYSFKMADSMSIDAFGRLRVSEPESLFDSKQTAGDTTGLFWDDVALSGAGTSSTYSNNRASITIYDIYGKAVFGKTDIQLLRGNNTILIDLLKNNNYLSAGVYRVVLQSGQWIVQSNYLLIQ